MIGAAPGSGPGPTARPCPTCGARHGDLATAMGSASPHAWDVATAAQRDAGELTDDVCFLPDTDPGPSHGGTSYFLRGEVALPLLDGGT